jgi:hypothetical protein
VKGFEMDFGKCKKDVINADVQKLSEFGRNTNKD